MWAYVVVAVTISTITCMILINSKRQQASTSDQEEEKENCGDVVNDVAARFIKDLDEQVKLLPEKKYYYGAYRTSDVKIIPRNEKSHRCSIVPTNQKARRRPRQQTKRR